MQEEEIRNPNDNWVAADNLFPMMLYRTGSAIQWDGRGTDTKIVADSTELATALATGWAEGADYAADAPVGEAKLLDKSAMDIKDELSGMELEDLETLKAEETDGKARKGVLAMIDAAIDGKLG